jgi:hypothetical protein
VSLIELLTKHASAVIAGDDDQALYGFKQASSKYLRDLTKREDFERFDLPYCSRCTSVLVDAIHRVVECAQQSQGLLAERIEKPYWCYLPEKRRASERYPKIIDAHCSVENNNANYMCRYIEQQILRRVTAIDIEQSRKKGYPTVLVIAPVEFGKRVYNHLTKQGMPNVVLKTSAVCEIELLDGYLRLMDDERSRLGWRILVHLLKPAGWKKAVRKAMTDCEELVDLLDEGFVADQLKIVTTLRRGYEGEALSDSEIDLIENALGIPITDIFEMEDKEEQPTVWITSLVGAKGLQAEHVFVAGMNDRHFPRLNSSVTEDEICMLLVALTRARQSCDLISCGRFGGQALQRSVFLKWLSPLTQYVRVDAEYWRRASAREAEESQQL